ncbi:helix-turn-helix transcriptional regulator [Streptomyces sp. NPDC057854]|uniref:helix-turn-helix transcriptional regulator n=1 Tax=unclassified Streptomyces TaxID=2593676 RepID=UPI0036B7BD58
MSRQQIADQIGCCPTNIDKILRGNTKTVRRNTYEAILQLRFEAPVKKKTRHQGARLDARPSVRRIQALMAIGFTQVFQGDYLGMSHKNLNLISLGKTEFIYAVTAAEVAEMYQKLHNADPADFGIPPDSIRRAKSGAAGRLYAPPSAWDEDTIDDPDAFPEWTGACGTDEGYRIHLREEIPLCEPCRRLVQLDGPSQRFSGTKLRIRMDQLGLDAHQLAARTGISLDSIRRWAWGQRRPHHKSIEALAAALDCGFNDLIEGEEDVIQEQDFNRIKFAVAMEDKGVTYKALAARIGISHMAVYYWLNGKNTPKIPKIVRAAEELEADWKDFYR